MQTQQSRAESSSNGVAERALVLGGGGAAGNAWEIGVIAGLFDAGLDVTEADLIIGTSAGSTAAAQISGARPTELLAAILAAGAPATDWSGGSGGGPSPTIGPVADHDGEDGRHHRRRRGCGRHAPQAGCGGARDWTRRRTAPGKRSGAPPSPLGCPASDWPERPVHITAVDAHTGEPVVFDRHSGVDLVDAVAASCASGFAYSIGDNRYIDGGYRRSSENADLAAGYGRVLVLSPFGGRSRHAAGVGHASRSAGRRTARRRQQGRDDLPGQRLPRRVRRQRDGSVGASARRSSRLRPRQSPCRAAHRILALTPQGIGP